MQNLFDRPVHDAIILRINSLTPASRAKWGKMNVAQMLAHCAVAFGVPLSDKKLKGSFLMRMIGPLFKKQLYDDRPWKQNLPTSPAFKIVDERDFETEKKKLLSLVDRFHTAGPNGISKFPHPIFGHFTSDQWGQSMFKHLDHHLRQFGA